MIKQRAKQELPGRLVSVGAIGFLLILQEPCLETWPEFFLPLKCYSEKAENKAGASADKKDKCRPWME